MLPEAWSFEIGLDDRLFSIVEYGRLPRSRRPYLAQLGRIRIYIRYDVLTVAELRSILNGVERTYNEMDSFFSGRGPVLNYSRLRVESVNTGNSLEANLIGNAPTIIALAYLIHLISKERLLYWQTEKAKWGAKLAEKRFRQDEDQENQRQIDEALRKENRNLMTVMENIQRVNKLITRSSGIVSGEVQFVVDEEPTQPKVPKRRILLEDES
jgi:hypothetical protein